MLAKRLPLLSAFAGGCLSGAVLLGVFRSVPVSTLAPGKPEVAERAAEPLAPLTAPPGPAPASAHPVNTGSVGAEPAPPKNREDASSEPTAEAGSSVAEVLARLETEYRQRLVPAPVTTSVTAAPAPVVPAHEEPAVMLAAPAAPPQPSLRPAAAPPALMAQAAAPAAVAAPPVATPPVAAPPVAPPAAPQNTYLGSGQQGDVYQIQQQVQQLAMLQYIQLLALSPYARLASPGYAPRRGATRQAPAFSSSLTNPDNPWGFAFPPTILAK